MSGNLTPGTVLQGRYKVVKEIASGGMGTVYEVEDDRLSGKKYALKVPLMSGLSSDQLATALESFNQETSILVRLTHPGIAQVHDSFTEAGQPYLVVEFVEGKTLAELIASRKKIDQDQVIAWSLQILDVLKYLHGMQPPFIYRDLKPENIMIDSSDHLKLIDFGTTRVFKPGKDQDTQLLGTIGFAAPEQFGKMGQQTDARADIYSLGATMHYMLTGANPEEKDTSKLFDWDPVSSLAPGVSPEIDRIVLKCLQEAPDARYRSAADLEIELRAAAATKGQPVPGTGLPSPAIPLPKAPANKTPFNQQPLPHAPLPNTPFPTSPSPGMPLQPPNAPLQPPPIPQARAPVAQPGPAMPVAAPAGSHTGLKDNRWLLALIAGIGVLILIAVAVGVVVLSKNKNHGAPSSESSTQQEQTQGDSSTGVDSESTGTSTSTPTNAAATTSTSEADSSVPFWTVVVESFDQRTGHTREDAERYAEKLRAMGLHANVLDSTRFLSLRQPYWVVYSGVYKDPGGEAAAINHASEVRSAGFPGAYQRYVDRNGPGEVGPVIQ